MSEPEPADERDEESARTFTLDFRVAGRQRRVTIGRRPEWTAMAARERAKELRSEIGEGGNPFS